MSVENQYWPAEMTEEKFNDMPNFLQNFPFQVKLSHVAAFGFGVGLVTVVFPVLWIKFRLTKLWNYRRNGGRWSRDLEGKLNLEHVIQSMSENFSRGLAEVAAAVRETIEDRSPTSPSPSLSTAAEAPQAEPKPTSPQA